VPPSLIGKTLTEAKLRDKYRLNLVTTRSKDADGKEDLTGVPDPNTYHFAENDQLIVFGREQDIRKFSGTN
jgi:Trk K+ transport system NAD-binding subunit